MPGSGVSRPVAFVRTLQIIVATMTTGCVLLLIVTLVIRGAPADNSDTPIVTYIMSALAVIMVGARLVAPQIVVARARTAILRGTWKTPWEGLFAAANRPNEMDAAARLFGVFGVRTIVAGAILEGAVFALLVAYFVEGAAIGLAFAAVLIVALAAHFPTASRVAAWVEDQTRLLDEERSL